MIPLRHSLSNLLQQILILSQRSNDSIIDKVQLWLNRFLQFAHQILVNDNIPQRHRGFRVIRRERSFVENRLEDGGERDGESNLRLQHI